MHGPAELSTSTACVALQNEVDIGLEDEVARNPYSVKSWLAYTDAKSSAAPQVRYNVYERSVRLMPGSYKLWVAYLADRLRQVCAREHRSLSSSEDNVCAAAVTLHRRRTV